MRSIVVTGGSGYIGSRVVDEAKRLGYHTVGIDIAPARHDLTAGFVRADIRERIAQIEVPRNADITLVHLAAASRDPGYSHEEYFDVNVGGTQRVLSLAERIGARNVIFASSGMIFAPSDRCRRVEDTPCPITAYGASKALAEGAVRHWEAARKDRRAAILRLAVVFGPGDTGNFEQLRRQLARGMFVYAGRRDTVKSCVYIDDVVRFVSYLLSTPTSGTFHLSIRPAPTIEQIVSSISKTFGYSPRLVTIPFRPLRAFARAVELIPGMSGRLPLSARRVEKLHESTYLEQEFHDTGFELLYPTIDDATCAWSTSIVDP